MQDRSVVVPSPDASPQALRRFSGTYNGYARIMGDSSGLQNFYQPFEVEFRRTHRLPEGFGLDLLRGWLFLLGRMDRFSELRDWTDTEDAWLDRLWRSIVAVIGEQAGERVVLVE